MRGKLIVFEGPDGVGKTTLSTLVAKYLSSLGVPNRVAAFPGNDPGTLGHLVRGVHHHPQRFATSSIGSTPLQLLHVAAHIESLYRHRSCRRKA
jgi:dTMP kinase